MKSDIPPFTPPHPSDVMPAAKWHSVTIKELLKILISKLSEVLSIKVAFAAIYTAFIQITLFHCVPFKEISSSH